MTGNCLLIFLKHYEDDDSLKDDENYGGASMMNLSFLGGEIYHAKYMRKYQNCYSSYMGKK